MNKEIKEKIKQEKTESLDVEILKLEKEKEFIQVRHAQKIKEIDEKLEMLKFQSEVFKAHKVK